MDMPRRSQDFSKGGGGVTPCQSEATHQILSCRPPSRVFDFKKSFKKGFLTMAKISSWHFRHLF